MQEINYVPLDNFAEEKADNKKNESMERKKKEEKLKMKAEKEARKVALSLSHTFGFFAISLTLSFAQW